MSMPLNEVEQGYRADLIQALRDETKELRRRLREEVNTTMEEKLAAGRRIFENGQLIIELEWAKDIKV